MITAEMLRLIRAKVTLYPPVKVIVYLPPLVNAEGLSGDKSLIGGDAGMLSGKLSWYIYGDASGKRGVVSEKLLGDWSKITGDISGIEGWASGVEGDATGKRGSINGIYGNFTKWRGEMSGISGHATNSGGDATGIIATIDEIEEALKGVGGQVP
jgi:hypothetical protein